jgi:hypothetical protein
MSEMDHDGGGRSVDGVLLVECILRSCRNSIFDSESALITASFTECL